MKRRTQKKRKPTANIVRSVEWRRSGAGGELDYPLRVHIIKLSKLMVFAPKLTSCNSNNNASNFSMVI